VKSLYASVNNRVNRQANHEQSTYMQSIIMVANLLVMVIDAVSNYYGIMMGWKYNKSIQTIE